MGNLTAGMQGSLLAQKGLYFNTDSVGYIDSLSKSDYVISVRLLD